MFVDEVDIQVAAGDGGRGCVAFAARSSFRAAGPTAATAAMAARSSWSPARISTPSSTSASIPSSRPSAAGTVRARTAPGASGDDLELAVPVGTLVYETTADGERAADCRSRARTVSACSLRKADAAAGATPNSPHPPTARRARSKPGVPGESKRAPAATQAARRRRARRLSQRRQVDAHRSHLGRTAQDCRLSVYDADAQPRRRAAQRRPQLRRGRCARADRRRPRGHGLGTGSCGTSSAPKCWFTWWTSRAPGRDPVDDLETVRREFGCSHLGWRTSRNSWRPTRLMRSTNLSAARSAWPHLARLNIAIFPISAVTGEGVPELIEAVWKRLSEAKAHHREAGHDAAHESNHRPVDTLER